MPKGNLHPVTGCRVDSLFEDVWLISPEQLEQRVQQVARLDLNELIKQRDAALAAEVEIEAPDKKEHRFYEMFGSTAVITISGITTKYPTSFQQIMGGTSTALAQRALRLALADPNVENIMLHVDSCPGGNASGAFDLAEDIRKTAEMKPLAAHIDDQGTSAALLFASQAGRVTANRNAQVGSIGVLSKLVDTSKMYEARGMKVIPIVAGKLKGVGMDGVPITPEQIQACEEQVADLNDVFVGAVSRGRGISEESIRKLEARTFISERAKKYGLVDGICQFDQAMSELRSGKVSKRSSGPAPEDKPNPAATRSRVMLKPEQLVQAKSLPGAAHITAENADEVLFQSCSNLSARNSALETELSDLRKQAPKTPAKMDPKLAEGHVKLFLKDLEFQVRDGKMLPAQAEIIKASLCPADGQYNLSAVQSDGTVLLPADVFIKAVEGNKPNGVSKELTGAQPAPKTEPGSEKKVELPNLERLNSIRSENGLVPLTMEEYNKQFPKSA